MMLTMWMNCLVAGGYSSSGWIAEFIVYQRYISDEERQEVEG
jgi:hypothetical protein